MLAARAFIVLRSAPVALGSTLTRRRVKGLRVRSGSVACAASALTLTTKAIIAPPCLIVLLAVLLLLLEVAIALRRTEILELRATGLRAEPGASLSAGVAAATKLAERLRAGAEGIASSEPALIELTRERRARPTTGSEAARPEAAGAGANVTTPTSALEVSLAAPPPVALRGLISAAECSGAWSGVTAASAACAAARPWALHAFRTAAAAGPGHPLRPAFLIAAPPRHPTAVTGTTTLAARSIGGAIPARTIVPRGVSGLLVGWLALGLREREAGHRAEQKSNAGELEHGVLQPE